MAKTTTRETIRIQVVAFVVLAACALALGFSRPAHAAPPVCPLDGAPQCHASR